MAGLKETAENLKAGAEKARNTKSTRIWFMVGLAVVVFVLWWVNIIKTGFAIGLGIIILAAIGIETFNYDLDLGKLWETGSISESRVTHTKDGLKIMGSCAIPMKGEGDLNCANFQTQPEAQAKYDQCASEIASYNDGVDAAKVKSLDIYGLDKNKNGIVCEALPGAPKEEAPVATETTEVSGTAGTAQTRSTSTQKATTKKPSTTNTYSTTPIPRVTEPYPVTTATVKTNPKTLPQ